MREEDVRTARIWGAALLAVAATAAAQPPKHTPTKPVQPNRKPAEVVLASAETVHPPVPSPSLTEAPKRPLPRITHCRCGDPDPSSEDDQ